MVDIDIEMIYIYYSFSFPRSTAFVGIKLWNASISYMESYSYSTTAVLVFVDAAGRSF